MNRRVPVWELEDPPNSSHGLPINPSSTGTTVDAAAAFTGSRSDYEVTELTWVNGHPSMHGLRHFRMGKPVPKCPSPASWDKVIAGGGTLESVVDQATGAILLPSTQESPTTDSHDLAPWVRPNERPGCSSPATGVVMEALEPCSNQPPMLVDDHSARIPEPPAGATVVSGVGRKRGREWNRSLSGSAASMRVPSDACDNNGGSDDVAFTTSTYTLDRSPDTEHASCGKALTVVDEHDSASPSRRSSKDEGCCVGGEKKKRTGEAARSSVSTKRSRAAAVHNQSERKRRERINQRIKTLQKLVPNSIKTDKASILDEVIEYLKHLQAQVQMMGRSSAVFHMTMPMPMRQQLQMAMMAKMAQTGMDLNTPKRPPPSQSTVPPPSAAFFPFVSADRVQPPVESTTSMPTDPFSVFMAGQPQKPLMSIDAFSRMASVYQHAFQQPQAPPNPKPK